nr:MAG TPA: hypothetical protein [Caudoviricetes sp.]
MYFGQCIYMLIIEYIELKKLYLKAYYFNLMPPLIKVKTYIKGRAYLSYFETLCIYSLFRCYLKVGIYLCLTTRQLPSIL